MLTAPVPSTTSITYALFKFIANHPLIINPPIYHPETGEQIKINLYRMYQGINPDPGVICSIYPTKGADGSPSVIYEPYELGPEGIDQATYNFNIDFAYNEVTINNLSNNYDLITTAEEAAIHPDEVLLTSNIKKTVQLYVNPAVDIIGDYLSLAKLALNDTYHCRAFPIPVSSMNVVHTNLRTGRWEQGTDVYFHEGELKLKLDAFISRGWRDRFDQPLSSISVYPNLLDTETIKVNFKSIRR